VDSLLGKKVTVFQKRPLRSQGPYMPAQQEPAPQACAPGQAAPVEQAGSLESLPLPTQPGRDMSFSVFFDLHAGQGSVSLLTRWTISSNTFPHFLHSNS
jgi:hypothetical protein